MDERQHYECQKWMTTALKESPQVVFMLERLERAGCKFNIQHFKSIPFASIHTGGFVPTHGVKSHPKLIIKFQLFDRYLQLRIRLHLINIWKTHLHTK